MTRKLMIISQKIGVEISKSGRWWLLHTLQTKLSSFQDISTLFNNFSEIQLIFFIGKLSYSSTMTVITT